MDFWSHDGAEHREKRLKKAAVLFCEIAGIPYAQAQALIGVMRDDHGRLDVCWRHGEPSHRQREAFATAWRLVGESPDAVTHTSKEQSGC